MRNRTALGLIAVLIFATVVDPYGWMYFRTYDMVRIVWWEVAAVVVDLGMLVTIGALLLRGRTGRAVWLSAVECVLAVVLGVYVTHADLIRNAAYTWLPLRELLLLYVVTLLLRCLLAGYLYFQCVLASVGLPLTPDGDGRFAA